MRPRPSAVLALVGAISAALALNGCSHTVQPNGTIAGANGTSGTGSASATATDASAEPSSSYATHILPSDLSLLFTDPYLGRAQEGVYQWVESFVNHYEAAAGAGTVLDAGLATNMTAVAAVAVNTDITSDDQGGRRWSGTIRFYDFQVSIASASNIGAGLCESDAEAYPVSIKSDSRQGNEPTGTGALRAWVLGLARTSSGGYQVTSFSLIPGDAICV